MDNARFKHVQTLTARETLSYTTFWEGSHLLFFLQAGICFRHVSTSAYHEILIQTSNGETAGYFGHAATQCLQMAAWITFACAWWLMSSYWSLSPIREDRHNRDIRVWPHPCQRRDGSNTTEARPGPWGAHCLCQNSRASQGICSQLSSIILFKQVQDRFDRVSSCNKHAQAPATMTTDLGGRLKALMSEICLLFMMSRAARASPNAPIASCSPSSCVIGSRTLRFSRQFNTALRHSHPNLARPKFGTRRWVSQTHKI